MSQIKIENLSFQYPGSPDVIFSDVSFTIDSDWRLGFVGRNGRGKTTFLHLLQNKYAYSGHINASVAFEYFPFEVENKWDLVMNVIEAVDPAYEQWRIKRELTLLGLDDNIFYRVFDTLSNGEQTKLLLSILFAKENRFLLIDEPTNHLDQLGRTQVAEYLKTKKGYILVSHDRHFIDGCVDHILAINKTGIEVIQGNFTTWWNNKESRDRFEQDKNEQLKKEISRLDKAAKRTEKWSTQLENSKIGTHAADRGFVGHKAAKMMQRSKNIVSRSQEAIESKKGLLKDIELQEDLKLSPITHHAKRLVEAKDFVISYNGKPIFAPLTFCMMKGDIVSLYGQNGSGKSSLIKSIMGESIAYDGTLQIASGLIISYVPQDSAHLTGSLDRFIEANGLDATLFKTILRKFDMKREQFGKDLSSFSQGQKKKVLLAKSLCEKAHLYIWDEPLNYIDVFSRMQLEKLLSSFRPTMLMVEHDKAFSQSLATQTIALSPSIPSQT